MPKTQAVAFTFTENDMKTIVRDNKEDIHVVPIHETGKHHKTSLKCWCRPRRTFKNPDSGISVWSHYLKVSNRKKD
jgi:hypothetical protein